MIREMRVARAAPVAPICGAPIFPYMNTQLRNMLSRLQNMVMPIATVVLPIPSMNCLNDRNIMYGNIDAAMSM